MSTENNDILSFENVDKGTVPSRTGIYRREDGRSFSIDNYTLQIAHNVLYCNVIKAISSYE